ncbi:MAG: hypothetical protein KC425_09000 [Anaerolineales bacterium]|nr:hypothetical protein [Anaerolineales bacterium]
MDDLTALADADLRTVCGRLGVSFSGLGTGSVRQKGERLLARLAEQGRLAELPPELVRLRPYLAARYDQADPLNWIEQLDAAPDLSTPLQITANIARLHDVAAEPDAPADNPPPPGVMHEAPTAQWDSDRHPALHARGRATTAAAPGPYQPGDVLRTQALFFGRQAERQQLRAHLQEMQGCVIVGLPYSGKSSLVYQVLHYDLDPAWNGLPAFLELSQLRYTALPDLLNHVLAIWYGQMGQDSAPVVRDGADFARQVTYLAQGGYRPMLCLDALAYLFTQPFTVADGLLRQWRALQDAGHLALLVTSQAPPAAVLRQQAREPALTAGLAQIDLGLLDAADAHELVRQPAARHGVYLQPETVAELLALCGPHPFFLQLGAALLLAQPEGRRGVTPNLYARFAETAAPYFLAMWQALAPLQQSLLAAPLRPDPPIVVARQYRALARLGLLLRDEAGYRPFGSAFAAWLQARTA